VGCEYALVVGRTQTKRDGRKAKATCETTRELAEVVSLSSSDAKSEALRFPTTFWMLRMPFLV